MGFIHLHTHSHFSLLQSTNTMEGLFRVASEDKMPALALTDHGNMFGALDFFLKGKEWGVKPIIGCEVYVVANRFLKMGYGSDDGELAPYDVCSSGLHHLVLLCQNDLGYQNLCRLVSLSYLEGFYYRPRVDAEILARYSEGLVALSGCLKGEIPYWCLAGNRDKAREKVQFYKSTYPDRFYLEMQAGAADAELFCKARFIPASPFQSFADHFSFELL